MRLYKCAILSIVLIFTLTTKIKGQNYQLSFKIGSSGNDLGHSICVKSNGFVYVVGYFTGSNVDFDPSSSGNAYLSSNGLKDGFVAKFTSAGQYLWSFKIGGVDLDEVNAVSVDLQDNVYITGYFRGNGVDFDPSSGTAILNSNGQAGGDPGYGGDMFLAKYSSSGQYLWAFNVGGSLLGDNGMVIANDNVGNVFVSGYFRESIDFDPSTSSYNLDANTGTLFVAKYSTLGQFSWAFNLGAGNVDNSSFGIKIDGTGSVCLTGYFQGVNKDFDPSTSGTANISSVGGFDVFVAKYNNNGQYQWAFAIGGNAIDVGRDLEVDNLGNVYVAGDFDGSNIDFDPSSSVENLSSNNRDVFIAKYNSSGQYQWAKRFGANGIDIAWSLAYADNHIYITGSFQGIMDFNPGPVSDNLVSNGANDFYITKFDVNGNYVCAFNIGGAGNDDAYRIVADNNNNLYLTGILSSTNTDFNPGPTVNNLSSNGNSDIFVAKYNWPDNPKPMGTFSGNSICPGQQAQLTFTATSGTGPFIIEFSNGSTVLTQTNVQSGVPFNISPNPTVSTTYNLISIRDATVCPSTNNVNGITATVTITAGGTTDFFYTQSACSPKTIQFFATNSSASNFSWDFGNGVTATATSSPVVTYVNYGNYTVKLVVGSTGSCKDSAIKLIPVFLSQSDIILSKDTTICAGTSIRLATDSGVGFCWKPDPTIGQSNIANTIVTPVANTIYYFTSQVLGTNLVNNGNFSAGNFGFTSIYIAAFPNTLEGEYWVDSNPNAWNGGLSNCTDHTSGIGKMLMVNGKQPNNAIVWSQTISITPNKNYAFSLWLQSLHPINPANLSFSINGKILGNSIVAGTTPCNWKQFFVTWNSGTATAANISIVNKNTVAGGNDFALDDISFSEVNVRYDTLKVNVSPPPNIISIKDTSICKGDSVQLTTNGGNTYFWSSSVGLSDTTVSNPIAVPDTTTSFIVSGYLQPGCIGRDTVKVTVLSPPVIGLIDDTTLCTGSPLQLFASGGTDYTWTPTSGLSAYTVFNPSVNAIADIIYYVKVKGANGCFNSDSVVIKVVSKPIVKSIPDTVLCKGSPLILTTSISGATSFSWSPATGLLNPNSASPQAITKDSTLYIITATNNGCTAADSVILSVLPLPAIDLSNDTTLCKGQRVQIQSYGTGNYSWFPPYNITSTSSSSPIVYPDTTTKYYVNVIGSNGCSNQDSIVVTISPSPFVKTIGDTTVCTNSNIILSTSTNSGSVQWSPGTGLNDSTIISPTANPSIVTRYIVTAQNAIGCESKDTVNVGVLFPPVIAASDDTTTCNKSNFQLFASGGVKYVWSPSSGLSDTTISNPIAVLDTSITYRVIVYGVNGCSMEDSVKIKIGTGRPFTLDPAFPQICSKLSVALSAFGGDQYNWFFGENIVSPFNSTTTVMPTKTGIYKVQIIDTVCKLIDTLMTTVEVNELPLVAIKKSNDIDCFNRKVQLSANGGLSYQWSPLSGLSNGTIGNPVVSPGASTTYYVTVTDRNGCSNVDSIKVFVNYNVNQNSYQVPNAFTPNGDGKNDCFGVVSWGDVEQLQLSVYNRWGERVFYTTNSSECWDGTYKNVPQNSGAFVFLVSGKTKCGGALSNKGTVLLIR